jgi:hypothetical protein
MGSRGGVHACARASASNEKKVESIVNSRQATPGSRPLFSKLGEGDDRSRSELVDAGAGPGFLGCVFKILKCAKKIDCLKRFLAFTTNYRTTTLSLHIS